MRILKKGLETIRRAVRHRIPDTFLIHAFRRHRRSESSGGRVGGLGSGEGDSDRTRHSGKDGGPTLSLNSPYAPIRTSGNSVKTEPAP